MNEMPDKIVQLITKWNKTNRLTDDEMAELEAWLDACEFDTPLLTREQFEHEDFFPDKWDDIMKRAEGKSRPARRISTAWKVAAAVFFLIASSVFWWANRPQETGQSASTNLHIRNVNDILPGHEGAILLLGDGRSIVLDSAGNGLIAQQGNARISNENGVVSYASGSKNSGQPVMNSLSVPSGREYRLQLPDGSRVWLNSSSTITFPSEFSDDQRTVSIEGEAYFEVTKSKQSNGSHKPFHVVINTPQGKRNEVKMEVLGTSFNINAYRDEANIITTLVEGSVRVHSGGKTEILHPARQAITGFDGSIRVTQRFNMEQVLAWRHGLFYFDKTDVKSILRQFSRWYNIEIESPDSIQQRSFSGKLNRNMKLADVLKIMDLSNIQYSIKEGRMIIDEQPVSTPAKN